MVLLQLQVAHMVPDLLLALSHKVNYEYSQLSTQFWYIFVFAAETFLSFLWLAECQKVVCTKLTLSNLSMFFSADILPLHPNRLKKLELLVFCFDRWSNTWWMEKDIFSWVCTCEYEWDVQCYMQSIEIEI